MILKLWCKGTNKRECYNGINAEPLTTLVRNRDTLMILFERYLTMYHYGECSDYQNVVRKVRWNNDTMILFSKKKLFVRKFEKALCGAFSNKTCHIFIASTASPCPSRHP